MGSNLIRMTGLVSGMDTESIINMYASKTKSKLEKAQKSKTLNTWKQDAWKDLNSKIYSFYSKTLSTNRLSGAYQKQKTTTSNGALSVTAGAGAANGVQTAVIKQTAAAAYLTGNALADDVMGGSSLTGDLGIAEGTQLTFKASSSAEPKTIQIGGSSSDSNVTVVDSMDELVKTLKDSGVNANYDASNHRLFISAKETGEANDFGFTTDNSSAAGLDALTKLGIATEKNFEDYALDKGVISGGESAKEKASAIAAMKESLVSAGNIANGKNASKIDGKDAILELNGAEFKSSSNSMTINGSTYTINYMPANKDEQISVTTATDYDGVYDVVKSMLKEYNALVNEMSKLYNADSAKDYEPLTDEQKEAMSEKEVDAWEKKIKDSILRKDSTVNDVLTAMTDIMSQGIDVGGTTMNLTDFGISTQQYFEADKNERYALHIDGNPDDEVSSGKEDKLKNMITSDPGKVTDFFQKLSAKLYDKLFEKMSSNKSTSSIYKVYNDKQLASEATDWDKKIAELEDKVTAIEDKWYSRFAKMETKLAKLQKNQTAVGGFFGS
ncbi:MAG: flagellar filament capping protein FliD [Lachnospiraceae bacterium]|nr:flagellar filament capping protein FliD [Lachnospiraceae bacterium]